MTRSSTARALTALCLACLVCAQPQAPLVMGRADVIAGDGEDLDAMRLPGTQEVLLGLVAAAGANATQKSNVQHVNSFIGNGGDSPNGSGGMIPSVAPPFGMTRWVAQTRANYVSVTPYNYTDASIHGFQATRQPAIWMGESGPVAVVPGAGAVSASFAERGWAFAHAEEVAEVGRYSVRLRGEGERAGVEVNAEMSATSRVGHLRFTFSGTSDPYVLIEATRPSVIGSADPTNLTYPEGAIAIDPVNQEITGYNPERQDFIIGPNTASAAGFKGFFCARFSRPFGTYGVVQNGTVQDGAKGGAGSVLSAYVKFRNEMAENKTGEVVEVRVGTSFISVEQARRNLDAEIPDGRTLEQTAAATTAAWAEKLDRVQVQEATAENLTTFYTAVFHTLQYPSEQDEEGRYYSGYDDGVHEGVSYTGYSIWDTFRAEWAWLILMAPERIPDMIQSMVQDYKEGGWLPMWKNIVETNIMVGTHADSLVAEAVAKGFRSGFELETAWEAVHKDATVPPERDWEISYFDREENVGYEVRAGLSSVYNASGFVANDVHSEAGSRTLDYAYDDYAVSVLAAALNKSAEAAFFHNRSLSAPFSIFNVDTGFMEARNASGAWAGADEGWTEGDKWAYTFDVPHDVSELIQKVGGRERFVQFLDEHFDGGHNDHTNEPSHHIPYLYALAGAPSKSAERIRAIARADYNETVRGLGGNEDCGQMSAWYIFSALGFYPVDPVSAEYVVGAPFFDRITIDLPRGGVLDVRSDGAPERMYVRGVEVDGEALAAPVIKHQQIAKGGEVVFGMTAEAQEWVS